MGGNYSEFFFRVQLQHNHPSVESVTVSIDKEVRLEFNKAEMLASPKLRRVASYDRGVMTLGSWLNDPHLKDEFTLGRTVPTFWCRKKNGHMFSTRYTCQDFVLSSFSILNEKLTLQVCKKKFVQTAYKMCSLFQVPPPQVLHS